MFCQYAQFDYSLTFLVVQKWLSRFIVAIDDYHADGDVLKGLKWNPIEWLHKVNALNQDIANVLSIFMLTSNPLGVIPPKEWVVIV